ncbi:hypothetical protein RSAG8_03644, partial [Rhizoctonia solani AG-8 WAC10335]
MATNAQAVVVPNNGAIIRRRPVWGAGGLLAQSVSGLVNVPGLKDVAFFAKEGAKALKAPKLNDVQTRKQICSIEELLARVGAQGSLYSPKSLSTVQEELDAVESFRRDLEDLKTELERALSDRYATKFARQHDIAQLLAHKDEQALKRAVDFCVDGSLRLNRLIPSLSVHLEGESRKVANLEHQIQKMHRLQLVQGCVLFFFLNPISMLMPSASRTIGGKGPEVCLVPGK